MAHEMPCGLRRAAADPKRWHGKVPPLPRFVTGAGAVALVLAFAGVISAAATTGIQHAQAQEEPVPAEHNPPGDIPDDQVFIVYKSPLGFSLKVPEGWGRIDRSDGAAFADKYDTIDIAVTSAQSPPTIESVARGETAELERTGRAVKIAKIKEVRLRAGPAVVIVYSSNSAPNPVTGKQIRLENERYLLYHAGRLATLDLSAPLGADNVDQWQLISESFRWS